MADVASNIEQWSTTASSNSPSDATTIGAGLADNFQQIQATVRTALASKGADVASATTTDIGAVPGLFLDVTGTTTITGLGTIAAGIWKVLKFEGALTLTHNATSLILPGGGNITTADGDVAIMVSEGSGNWRCVCYAGKNSYATNGKFTGTLDVTGTITAAAINASGALTGVTGVFTGAGATPALSNGNLVVSSGTTTGAIIAGKGSGTDLYLANSSYQAVLTVATGTTNVTIPNGTFAVTNNATVGGTLGVSSTLTAVPGGTSHFNASGGRVYVAGNSSAIGLGLGYNKTRTDAAQTVFFGATDSATPDGVVSNSVGTEIVRFTNAGFVQTNGQYQIQLASVTKWQLYHDSGTSQFRIFDTNGAADAFKIATGGAVTIPGTLGVTGAITTTDGRLSITNTTSSSSFTSSVANADVLSITNNTGTAAQQYGYSVYLTGDPNDATRYFFNCVGTATSRIVGRSNGGIANFSANNVNLSDIRTKKDIQPAGEYLPKIMAIPVKTFLYKDQTDTDLNLGVIAQDVEAVAPELIDNSGFGETPEDGIPLKTIYQTDLQYALMKALQELAADFQAYKAAHP